MKHKLTLWPAKFALAALFIAMSSVGVFANNAWGCYHWARTANPFTLRVVDSNTPNWDGALDTALADWSQSSVMNLIEEAGSDANNTRKRCPMVSGKVRSCNASYGFNGWLGLASINITGGCHITQGTSKMNDSYFNSGSYTATNRQHVMCQEIGHDFGLDHQDESGADLNTCMDYSNALDNPHPNNHDYQQLESIYSHLDSTTTIASMVAAAASPFGDDPDAPHNWGRLVSQSANGRSSTYEHMDWYGNRTIKHVFWTTERAAQCPACDHRYHD
jgi:hypothetical protein